MSIVKDSFKETMSTKAFKILTVFLLLFFSAIFYFFYDVFSYREQVSKIEPVKLHFMLSLQKDNYDRDIYYKLNDKEKVYLIHIKNCKIKSKLGAKVIDANLISYDYFTTFRSGKNTRLEEPSELFCEKTV